MKVLIIGFVITFTAHPCFAYVPRAKTIIKKMTLNNGRRDYKIVREVSIEADEKQIRAREVWTVANGDKMKLEVSSLDPNQDWNFVVIYNKGQRKTLSAKGAVKSFKKSRDFFEPLFHDRYHKSLMRRMVQHRFIPDWTKDTPPPAYSKGKTLMTPEPYISLEPMEGSVSYAIGAKKSQSGGKSQTHLWVEQDSFLIKKGRLSSGAEFINSNFQTFTGGLKLPSEQTISWNNKVAKVKLLAVNRTKTNKKDFSFAKKTASSIPSEKLIKEFYSRFR